LKLPKKTSRVAQNVLAGRIFETLVYSLKLAKLHKNWKCT